MYTYQYLYLTKSIQSCLCIHVCIFCICYHGSWGRYIECNDPGPNKSCSKCNFNVHFCKQCDSCGYVFSNNTATSTPNTHSHGDNVGIVYVIIQDFKNVCNLGHFNIFNQALL
jgi:hypothetical protein